MILVDVTPKTVTKDGMLSYVGSSRAKLKLSVIMNADDAECEEGIKDYCSVMKRNNPKEMLAKLLGCRLFDRS